MEPKIIINYYAILVSVFTSWVIGSLWFGPVFGKIWAKEMKFPEDFKPEPKEMYKSMGLMILGTLITAYVLTHTSQSWRPSAWGLTGDYPDYFYGFFGAFFSWLGYNVPVFLNSVAFEGRSWKLFSINAGYQFVSLQAMAMILSFWK